MRTTRVTISMLPSEWKAIVSVLHLAEHTLLVRGKVHSSAPKCARYLADVLEAELKKEENSDRK